MSDIQHKMGYIAQPRRLGFQQTFPSIFAKLLYSHTHSLCRGDILLCMYLIRDAWLIAQIARGLIIKPHDYILFKEKQLGRSTVVRVTLALATVPNNRPLITCRREIAGRISCRY